MTVIAKQQNLTEQHYNNLAVERGIKPEWLKDNYCSVTQSEAKELGFKNAPSDGYLLVGSNGQRQFRPDKPFTDNGGKPMKYITPPGSNYDVMLPHWKDVFNQDIWKDQELLTEFLIEIGGKRYAVATEGLHKAVYGCMHSIATIALMGVEMGLLGAKNSPDGKRRLVPSLQRLCGFVDGFIIAFDADAATNPDVRRACKTLATALESQGKLILIATGLWDIQDGKGMDDFIQKKGIEAFREKLLNAMPLSAWEEKFSVSKVSTKKGKKTPADLVADQLSEELRPQLMWVTECKQWFRYEAEQPGVWTAQSDEAIEAYIRTRVKVLGLSGYGGHSYIVDIVKTLRCDLLTDKWNDTDGNQYLPFLNGVLDLVTGERLEHDRNFHFTWCLPREYDPTQKDWGLIDEWLSWATGMKDDVKTAILCFANAVLKGRYDLQKYLHLIGFGGNGKSVLIDLLMNLIGKENTHSSSLDMLCGNNFEAYNLYRKKLCIMPDESKRGDSVSTFKMATGGDMLRAEQKGKMPFNFTYKGMFILSSNYPIFVKENTSAIARREIVAEFNNTPTAIDSNFGKKLQSQLPAFTNYLLSLDDDFVSQTLGRKLTGNLQMSALENAIKSDPILWWLNEHVVYAPGFRTEIGSNKHEAKERDTSTPSSLFGSFCYHTERAGRQSSSSTTFSQQVLDICRNRMGWKDVEKKKTNGLTVIVGLRLRGGEKDLNIPTWLENLSIATSEEKPALPALSLIQQDFQPALSPALVPTEPALSQKQEEPVLPSAGTSADESATQNPCAASKVPVVPVEVLSQPYIFHAQKEEVTTEGIDSSNNISDANSNLSKEEVTLTNSVERPVWANAIIVGSKVYVTDNQFKRHYAKEYHVAVIAEDGVTIVISKTEGRMHMMWNQVSLNDPISGGKK